MLLYPVTHCDWAAHGSMHSWSGWYYFTRWDLWSILNFIHWDAWDTTLLLVVPNLSEKIELASALALEEGGPDLVVYSDYTVFRNDPSEESSIWKLTFRWRMVESRRSYILRVVPSFSNITQYSLEGFKHSVSTLLLLFSGRAILKWCQWIQTQFVNVLLDPILNDTHLNWGWCSIKYVKQISGIG